MLKIWVYLQNVINLLNMKKFLLILISFLFFVTGCKKDDSLDSPYFKEFELNLLIMSPPFPEVNMKINNDRSYTISSFSKGDSIYGFKPYNDTIIGVISKSEIDTLIIKSRNADAYNVKFTNTLNDSIDCNSVVAFIYTIKLSDNQNRSNILSYTYCYIPDEAYDLKNYANYLMNKYLKK